MSHTLTFELELDDETYAALRSNAELAGISPDELAGRLLDCEFRQLRRDAQLVADLNGAFEDESTSVKRE